MTDPSTVLNRSIDDVAARMTAGDASSDLPQRVLDRIGERRTPMWAWTLKPAIALAMIAIATIAVPLIRSSRSAAPSSRAGEIATERPTSESVPLTASTSNAGEPGAPVTVNRVVTRAPRTPRRPAAPPPISAAEATWRARAVPALATIEALSIDGIQPAALSIPQLDVKPLATAPANVVPMDGKGVR